MLYIWSKETPTTPPSALGFWFFFLLFWIVELSPFTRNWRKPCSRNYTTQWADHILEEIGMWINKVRLFPGAGLGKAGSWLERARSPVIFLEGGPWPPCTGEPEAIWNNFKNKNRCIYAMTGKGKEQCQNAEESFSLLVLHENVLTLKAINQNLLSQHQSAFGRLIIYN